jgi:hypothetical protein
MFGNEERIFIIVKLCLKTKYISITFITYYFQKVVNYTGNFISLLTTMVGSCLSTGMEYKCQE